MSLVVPAVLLVVAIVHALPLAGVLGRASLTRLYGVDAMEPNLEILLRHRAVLFGLLAAFMGLAIVRSELRTIALVAGSVSVGSFLVVAARVGTPNAPVARVVKVDVVVLALLVVAGAVHGAGW